VQWEKGWLFWDNDYDVFQGFLNNIRYEINGCLRIIVEDKIKIDMIGIYVVHWDYYSKLRIYQDSFKVLI
jgi:hypothetical protein